ncbi:MAG: hypothetical protein FWG70_10555 [Oscillospiraceae bacterium]|nr:hypothetical protein [Oscillospiraceae bacterium]
MFYFYLCLTILSAVLLITDIVLRSMEKIKSFGFEKRLFKFKSETVPIEKFFPETLTTLLICLPILGAAGMILDSIGFVWYLSLPFSVMTGMLVCFALQYRLRAAINKHKDKILPRNDKAAGIQGFAAERIDGDDYGLIEFEYNDDVFHAPAVSVYGTTISKFEKVVILFEENEFYFVQSIKEVYEGLED